MNALREAVFPIYGKDVQAFLLLGTLKFLVIFILTLTRDLKDTLVVTACGAEAITFLKFYGVLPASAVFFLVYSRASNYFGIERLWYFTCLPFIVFYLVFDFFLFEANASGLAADVATDGLDFVRCIGQRWSFSLFYVVSELYSSVSVGILFWKFANDVVPVDQSRVFYPLFGQVSSLAPIVAGIYVRRYAAADGVELSDSVHRVCSAVVLCGGAMLLLHSCCRARVIDSSVRTAASKKTQAKTPMGLVESIRFLSSSAYLGYLAVLVLSYGLTIQFTDIVWKSLVKKMHPDPIAYQRYFADFSSQVGIVTFVVIFFGSNLVKNLGWRVGALTTPILMGCLGIPFFVLLKTSVLNDEGSALGLIVAIGALQSMLSKAAKNAFFDPTTQMAYIPLDKESKTKGKAAIDVLGSRIGKSGGALIQQGLVFAFGNILDASGAVAVLFFAVLAGWTVSATRLSLLFQDKVAKMHAD